MPRFVREEERAAQATTLIRTLVQDAARLGISVEELVRALNVETGAEIRE